MKSLLSFAVIAILPLLGMKPQFDLGSRNFSPVGGGGAAACASTISGVKGDWWAGSLSTTPVIAWADSSTNANSLNAGGTFTWANNTFGTGLAGVTMPGSDEFTLTSTIPVSTSFSGYAVIKTASASVGLTGPAASGVTLSWWINASNQVEIDASFTTLLCNSTGTITPGTTTEIAFTIDGTTCKIYINNTLDSTTAYVATFPDPIDLIGVLRGATAPFNGSIYELALSTSSTYTSTPHTCWAALGLP